MGHVDDLDARLRHLAADQPTQPGDRLPGVTRRARRIRRNRVAIATVTTVMAVLAIALPLRFIAPGGSTDLRFIGSDVTSWPDRSTKEDRAIAEGAVTQLARDEPATKGMELRWLYRGTPAYGQYFALFVGSDSVSAAATLFVATTDRAGVDDRGQALPGLEDPGGPGLDGDGMTSTLESRWRIQRLDLTEKRVDTLGFYVSGAVSNTVFLLANPSTREISWQEAPLPFAPAHAPLGGTTRSKNGVFVFNVGFLRGPVLVDGEIVGEGLSQPHLAGPAFVEGSSTVAGTGDQLMTSDFGQSEPQEGGGWDTSNLVDLNPKAGTTTLRLRCYGGGAIVAQLRAWDDIRTDEPLLASSRIPCDGATHRGFTHTFRRDQPFRLELVPDRLQAYQYWL